LQGSCVYIITRARNPLAVVQERSQGKLLTLCKADPRLLHPVRLQQARVLLMTFVLEPLLACKLNTLLSSATIQPFQGFIDLELFMALQLRWKEITTSKMWHLGRHARRKRFWCKLHEVFYSSVVMHKSRAPIVPCKYVDWKYYEDMKNPFFNEAMDKCKEMGLYDIMGFRYDWNEEILGQFHSSL